MKKSILLALLILNATVNFAQITFEKSYKKLVQEEAAQSIIENSNGNYIVATGGKYNSPSISREFGLTELNSYGDSLWYKVYSMNYHPIVRAVRKSNTAYYVLGQSDDTAQINTYMIWLNKFDLQGNIIWSKYYSDPDISADNFGLNFDVVQNGNIFISNGYSGFYNLDSNGMVINKKNYYYFLGQLDYFMKSDIEKQDSLYYFIKLFSITGLAPYIPKILVLNSNCDSLNSYSINLDSSWGNPFLTKIGKQQYIIGVIPPIIVPNDYGIIMSKLDSIGGVIWRKRISGLGYLKDFLTSHTLLKNQNIILSGFHKNGGNPNIPPASMAFLYCFNDNGDSLWYKEFSPSDTTLKTEFYDVIATADSGILACGQMMRPNGVRESYIVKLDANGNLFNPLNVILKKKESYLHVYPNPANSYTSFHYMGLEKNALLSIYNAEGKLMDSFQFNENDERLTISTMQYPSGVYSCNLSADGTILVSKKLSVIK